MAKGERLDKLGSVLSKLPIVNRFEVDKVLKIVKAIWIEPLIIGILLGISFGTIQYYNNPTQRLVNILLIASAFLILFVIIYTLKAMYLARVKEETERYKLSKKSEDDKKDLIEQVLKHQEGLRVEWFKTWQEYLKFQLGLQIESIKEIAIDENFSFEMRNYLIIKVIEKFDQNFDKLGELLPLLTADYEHFIISHAKAPPLVQTSAKEYIKNLIDKLD